MSKGSTINGAGAAAASRDIEMQESALENGRAVEVEELSAAPAGGGGRRKRRSPLRRAAGVVLKVLVPAVVLVAALAGAKRLIDTAPQAPRRPAQRQAKLVEVAEAVPVSRQVVLDDLMGTVGPARAVELRPQVAGRIEWISDRLEPGGQFEAGEELVRIEARDFELAVAQRESDVRMARARITEAQRVLATAERDLALEMGSQSVARREYELLQRELEEEDTSLVLREPQLAAAVAVVASAEAGVESAEAELAGAEARLEMARLQLARTSIRAPFAAVVETKQVEVGDAVGVNTVLVGLVGTEEYWVELAVGEQDLQWVEVDGESGGSRVRLFNDRVWPAGVYREGRVIRRLPSVSRQGRMARLLVAVEDPLGLEAEHAGLPALLVESYVRAEILGRRVEEAFALERAHVRGMDEVWVMTEEDRLAIRDVEVVYRGRDEVLVTAGLAAGERVVTSNLVVPVEGMALRTGGENSKSEIRNPKQGSNSRNSNDRNASGVSADGGGERDGSGVRGREDRGLEALGTGREDRGQDALGTGGEDRGQDALGTEEGRGR